MVPVVALSFAMALVKVKLPKFAKIEIWLFTVGLSIIHSAVSRVELYAKFWLNPCPVVKSWIDICHVFMLLFSKIIEALISSPGETLMLGIFME